MKAIPLVIAFLVALLGVPLQQKEGAKEEWREACSDNTVKRFWSPKQIYTEKLGTGSLVIHMWTKTFPKLDTPEGQQSHAEHLKGLKKKSKDKYKTFACQLTSLSFWCEPRRYDTGDSYDYDADGSLIYKWPKQFLIADIYGTAIVPGTVSECLMEIACSQSVQH